MTVPGPGCSWSTRLVSWTWKKDGSGKLAESITWQIQSLHPMYRLLDSGNLQQRNERRARPIE